MVESIYPSKDAHGIWVYLEHTGGRFEGVSLELLGRGRALADTTGENLTALLLSGDGSALAEEALGYGADEVLLAHHPALSVYTTLPSARVVADLIIHRRPNILLLGATVNGRDLAGRLAVRLLTGLTADCTDLLIDKESGLLSGEVTGFGQGILATIQCPDTRPQMATVRPGVFARPVFDPARCGRTEVIAVEIPEDDQHVQVLRQSSRRGVDITQAERLVIGGRGIQGDFALLRRLARALNADLGATRVAVDQGWIGHDRMVGQTGSVTRPKLALVCGASGAMQFTVGIQESETIVAINSDPEAPIFEVADYCIADDVFQVLPQLIEALDREMAGRKG
ncbi:MAG: electron transfer flavoprotein subunit alpha/FixB family protein [Dehalococcoidia bacterium]